jgi:subfamily B ATP-binding cassette protein MsbA
MYKPMRDLSKMTDTVSKASVGFERIRRCSRLKAESATCATRVRAPDSRAIEFDTSRLVQPGSVILDDVSFTIAPGRSRHSSARPAEARRPIINLVARFYDPCPAPCPSTARTSGVHDSSLRDQISFVLQDTLLFQAPIWQNIAYGRPEAHAPRSSRRGAGQRARVHQEMPEATTRWWRARRDAVRGPAPAHRHRASGDS